ncbi:peroxiredoxin [Candidatus Sumerlaeota bacterium]|nr:peroxiredoxin [Candidatus Sumerlaeota bacterium]
MLFRFGNQSFRAHHLRFFFPFKIGLTHAVCTVLTRNGRCDSCCQFNLGFFLETFLSDVLTIAEEAPDFTLASDSGEQITLSSYRGRQSVLLFFYPADFTPVCTGEVCAFRDDYEYFRAHNVALLGISGDSVERHQRFSRECKLQFPLLSDQSYSVARAYGAKGLLGMRRAYYLIDARGILRWQHCECLPVFRLCNSRLKDVIQRLLPEPQIACPTNETPYIPPPHL